MFEKTRGKAVATIMALALAISAIPAVGGVEAQAATKTKVLETQVNFVKDAETGDDSNVYLKSVARSSSFTFGTSYAVNLKIYVPAGYMTSGGSLYVSPYLDFYNGSEYIGWANGDGISFDKNSIDVTKKGDFYVVEGSVPVDVFCDDDGNEASFPEGKGRVLLGLRVVGEELDYKGNIYFDDISITVGDQVVASVDYEDGEIGNCSYTLNQSEKDNTPKVVTFTGNALNVSKTSLTIKKGKKATIKTTTMPSAKATFKSSNKKIATVTAKGVVKGIKKGKATITVKANGKTAKVKVTVK